MKSKVLSKSDRENILDKIKLKFEIKWKESPLHKEMLSIEKKAQRLLTKKQELLIPDTDKNTLMKYGVEYSSYRIYIGIDNEARIIRPYTYGVKKEFACITVKSFGSTDLDLPQGYPYQERGIRVFLIKKMENDLRRYIELQDIKECDKDATVKAFNKLLNNCNTTKQVAANDSLKGFLPDYLKNYSGNKRNTVLDKSDSALVASLA